MSENLRILILDNRDSFTYNLFQLISSLGVQTDVATGSPAEFYQVTNYSGLVFSPGPGLPDDFPLMKTWIHTIGKTKPILGICLGMQAMVTSFGGTLFNLKEVNHGVTRRMSFPDHQDDLFLGVPEGEEVGLYHSWAADPTTLPGCFNITATSHDGLILAVSHRSYPLKGVQFHPESVMTPCGKTILLNWLHSL